MSEKKQSITGVFTPTEEADILQHVAQFQEATKGMDVAALFAKFEREVLYAHILQMSGVPQGQSPDTFNQLTDKSVIVAKEVSTLVEQLTPFIKK